MVAAPAVAGVVVAGTNLFAATLPPPNLGDAVAASAGRDHILVLREDGTVAGFGYDGDGRATPPAGLSGVVAISAGIYHSLALKSDGAVVAWGFGGEGLTKVPAGLGGVVAIAAGGFHNLVRSGTVVGWGFNQNGRATPPAGLGGVVAIAAGRDHSVALKRDGAVVAWGQNDAGQTAVPAGLRNVTAISAGNAHTLALRSDGTVAAWGANDQGQCDVPAGLTGVTSVAGGNGYSLALTGDGRLAAWGDLSKGQAAFGAPGLTAISAGGSESVALAGGGIQVSLETASPSVIGGGDTTLRVTATGATDLSYQWWFNGRALPGATNSTLVIPNAGLANAGLANAGRYYAVVTAGGSSVASPAALLQVWGSLAIQSLRFDGTGAAIISVGDDSGAALLADDLIGWGLQSSTNLFDWFDVAAAGSLVNGEWTLADASTRRAMLFYRLKQSQ
jgi:hypothetical protein